MIEIHTNQLKNFHWPKPYRMAVAIGWHVDGMAGPIGSDERNRQHLGSLSMGQYGVSTALPRILELHEKHNIPGSFYIPAYVAEKSPHILRDIMEKNHEIGYHGYMHENVFLLSEKEEEEIMDKQIEILQNLCGKRFIGWSAPGWGVRKHTIDLLASRGLLYDCSLMEYDTPYRLKTDSNTLMELPISITLDDYEIFNASLFPNGQGLTVPAEDALKVYTEEFDGLYEYGGLYTTTFHPCILGRPGRLLMLDKLFQYMRQAEDVWFARYEDIARYAQTFV